MSQSRSLAIIRLLVTVWMVICGSHASATNYYVSDTQGSDAASRDGLSWATAWKTLGYASTRVPAGTHTITLGSGTFEETQATVLKAGWTIAGVGPASTIVQAPASWTPSSPTSPLLNTAQFIVQGSNAHNVTIRDLTFTSAVPQRAEGAGFIGWSDNLRIENVHATNFRVAGFYLRNGANAVVRDCTIVDSGTSFHFEEINGGQPSQSGLLMTAYMTNLEVANNVFRTTSNRGYGWRGRRHWGARVYGNTFDITGTFDLEVAHENEAGVQIYDNKFRNVVSVPKRMNGADPRAEGYPYSIRIYRNYSTSREFVEGSRGWLEIDHNFIDGTTGAVRRFYTNYGAVQTLPGTWTKIHHNVIVGNPLEFIFLQGTAEEDGLEVYNNTVYFTSTHTSRVIDFFTVNGATPKGDGWRIRNNIFVASSTAQREFWKPVVPAALTNETVSNNVLCYVTAAPGGNYIATSPGLRLSGAKPFPYYAPSSPTSFCVDKGVYYNYPANGATDAGAFEYGLVPPEIWLRGMAKHSGKPLTVAGAALGAGANVVQGPLAADAHQIVRFAYQGSGYHGILFKHSGHAVTSDAATNNVMQDTWSASNRQLWRPQLVEGHDYFKLEDKQNVRALDVTGRSTADGANVIHYPYSGGENQKWRFESPAP